MSVAKPLLYVILFAASWLVLCWLLGAVGGWQAMARHYAQGDRPFDGDVRRRQWGSLGLLFNYGRCLMVGRGPAGVRLALQPPVLVGHPPLLVPWSDLPRPSRARGVGPFRRIGLAFARTPEVTLWVTVSLAAWLEEGRPESA